MEKPIARSPDGQVAANALLPCFRPHTPALSPAQNTAGGNAVNQHPSQSYPQANWAGESQSSQLQQLGSFTSGVLETTYWPPPQLGT
ncbi:hypothetical protein NDU88_005479 [Pleurodeles waltl]|uniref:Uncharacterized protein n=1 Tax=Pleurodeles waltl TaxID=8319 RepID=A0AAV7WAS7_PLEWA|nr:hypothetical protein NDU88_005479 [Pleurodeles waltl]